MRTLSSFAMLLAVLLAIAVTPTAGNAKVDRRALAKAWGVANRLVKDTKGDPEAQADAVDKLNGLLDYKHAIKLLAYWESCDEAWDVASGKKGRPDPKVRVKEAYKTAAAIIEAVATMIYPKEVLKFKDDLSDSKKWALRPRMAMVDAIGSVANNDEGEGGVECLNLLIEMANNKDADTDMRIIAIFHLQDHTDNDDALNAVVRALQDRSWRIRDVAIEASVEFADGGAEDRIILALINALARETGRLRKNVGDALDDITGADLGTDPDEWSDWYREMKRGEKGLPPRKGGKNRGTRVRIFKTESFSDRYVFLIDTSVSMLKKITPEQKEQLKKSITSGPKDEKKDPRRPIDWSKVNCKLDLAREELIRSLEVLDPKLTMFTIISFAEEARLWKDELVPCDKKAVNAAAKWLGALKGKRRTNVFGALDEAWDLAESLAGIDAGKKKKKRKKKGKVVTGRHPDEGLPDTIFIYTDGFATWGKYSGDDIGWAKKTPREKAKLYAPIMVDMIKEITARNRIARITLHTIGVGYPQDKTTLSKLARKNRGKYVAIGNVKPGKAKKD